MYRTKRETERQREILFASCKEALFILGSIDTARMIPANRVLAAKEVLHKAFKDIRPQWVRDGEAIWEKLRR